MISTGCGFSSFFAFYFPLFVIVLLTRRAAHSAASSLRRYWQGSATSEASGHIADVHVPTHHTGGADRRRYHVRGHKAVPAQDTICHPERRWSGSRTHRSAKTSSFILGNGVYQIVIYDVSETAPKGGFLLHLMLKEQATD